MSLCSLLLSLETPNGVQSVAQQSKNTQATSKGSDQTSRMCRLILDFAGCWKSHALAHLVIVRFLGVVYHHICTNCPEDVNCFSSFAEN